MYFRPIPHYRVDADKGFNFSNADDAFVCQKKNHFQVSFQNSLNPSVSEYFVDYLPRPTPGRCPIRKNSRWIPEDLKLPHSLLRCKTRLSYTNHKGGTESERQKQKTVPSSLVCPNIVYNLKKNKVNFRVELVNSQVTKITVGRLHFSETTSNNMRKKGKPNPEQRYFQVSRHYFEIFFSRKSCS